MKLTRRSLLAGLAALPFLPSALRAKMLAPAEVMPFTIGRQALKNGFLLLGNEWIDIRNGERFRVVAIEPTFSTISLVPIIEPHTRISAEDVHVDHTKPTWEGELDWLEIDLPQEGPAAAVNDASGKD